MVKLKFKLLLFGLAWSLFVFKAKAQSDASYFMYTVKTEDKSLWGICQQHAVSVEAVKELNQLKRNGLRAGMQLKIPLKTQLNAIAGNIYTYCYGR